MNSDYHQTELWQKSRLLFLLITRQANSNARMQSGKTNDLLKSIVLALLHQISFAFNDSNKNKYQIHLADALSLVCLIKNKISETDVMKHPNPELLILLNRLKCELKSAIDKNAGDRLTVHAECDVNSILNRRWPYDKRN